MELTAAVGLRAAREDKVEKAVRLAARVESAAMAVHLEVEAQIQKAVQVVKARVARVADREAAVQAGMQVVADCSRQVAQVPTAEVATGEVQEVMVMVDCSLLVVPAAVVVEENSQLQGLVVRAAARTVEA